MPSWSPCAGLEASAARSAARWTSCRSRNSDKSKREKMRGRTWHGKAAVMGLLQRHPGKGKSRVRLQAIPDTRRSALRPIIDQHIEPKTEIFSDALRSYQELGYADSPYY